MHDKTALDKSSVMLYMLKANIFNWKECYCENLSVYLEKHKARYLYFKCSLPCGRRHWWDQPGTKCSSQALSMLALWCMEIIHRNRLKWKKKEEKTTATRYKSSWTNLLSAFWVKRREKLIQSQLPLRHY